MSLAGFPFQELNRKYLAQPSNDAARYGITISRAKSPSAYRCIGIYHLTPEQNTRRHNVYVDVLDRHGNRDKSPMLNWTVSASAPTQSKRLDDKPDNEPAADIPMNAKDTLTISISDNSGNSSDSVMGFHTRHPDEGTQNTLLHHSFYLVFQRFGSAIITSPVEPPTPVDPEPEPHTLESLAQRLAKLEVDYQLLQKELIDQGIQVGILKYRFDKTEGD